MFTRLYPSHMQTSKWGEISLFIGQASRSGVSSTSRASNVGNIKDGRRGWRVDRSGMGSPRPAKHGKKMKEVSFQGKIECARVYLQDHPTDSFRFRLQAATK